MPRYSYECQICRKRIELSRPIADRDHPEVNCVCGGEIVRVPDTPQFTVKGGTPKFHKAGA